MSENEAITRPRPAKAFFEKREKIAPRDAVPEMALDMGEASREEGFRLNGCR